MNHPTRSLIIILLIMLGLVRAGTDLKKLPLDDMLPNLRPSSKAREYKEGDALSVNAGSYLLPSNYFISTTVERRSAVKVPYEQLKWCDRHPSRGMERI